MATPKLDQHVLQEAVDVFAKYGEQAKAAAVLGLPTNTYKDRLRRAQQQGVKPSAGVEDAANIEHIRAKLRRTELELKVARGKALDEQAIRDGIFKLVQSVEKITTPSWLLRPRDSNASPGVPTLFLSDLHWGEVVKASQINGVNTYNVKIATARLRAAVEVAVYLLRKLSPKMDYDGIVCPLGGDMISGNIHE
jgi:hypothetical protein